MGNEAASMAEHDDVPNEFLIKRRTLLTGLLGTMLTPVSGLLSPALAQSALGDAVAVDDLLGQVPNMCRVATATVEGPYFIDKQLIRSDIRENQPGIPLELELQLVAANSNCRPIKGAMISIWHCNAQGEYSGYLASDPNQMPDLSSLDEHGHAKASDKERFLRGAQLTDAEGKVTFHTIVPGWYMPRAVHIHLRAFLGRDTMITSQLYFPQAVLNVIQSTHSAYQNRGVTIYTNENDLVRRQSGVSGMEDVLKITQKPDGSLRGTITLGAGFS